MKVLTLSIALLFLFGCTEQKKCQRFFKKHPKCFTSDTLVQYDTIKGIEIDTLFIGRNSVDTFIVDSSGVKVVTIVKWKDKVIRQTVTKRDTIIESKIIRQIAAPKIVTVKPKWVTGLLSGLFVFVILLLLLVYFLFKKR